MKLNARTNLECTALMLAFQNGRKYVVKLLVKNTKLASLAKFQDFFD